MIIDENAYLEHFGVKGMRWGVRKDHPGGVSGKVSREARKDAEEFARARVFYGEGAGTRRKLIKATVEGKSKRIPGYKQAFDEHLNAQDPSKHAVKAVSERKRTDRRTKRKQRAGAIARRATGEMGTQAAFVAVAAGGAAYLRSSRGQATMKTAASKLASASYKIKQKRGAAKLKDILKNM
jgi:hypothetical protein